MPVELKSGYAKREEARPEMKQAAKPAKDRGRDNPLFPGIRVKLVSLSPSFTCLYQRWGAQTRLLNCLHVPEAGNMTDLPCKVLYPQFNASPTSPLLFQMKRQNGVPFARPKLNKETQFSTTTFPPFLGLPLPRVGGL